MFFACNKRMCDLTDTKCTKLVQYRNINHKNTRIDNQSITNMGVYFTTLGVFCAKEGIFSTCMRLRILKLTLNL